jgi:5'-phosphate synthase pdxT subunit
MMKNEATIGVLALQGAFDLHGKALARLGAPYRLVKTSIDLHLVDALIIPGGESTTMRWLLDAENMMDDLAGFARTRPVMGTCAGMILLARNLSSDLVRHGFGVIDIDVRRNGYGRQIHSHTLEGQVDLGDGPRAFPMVFIRAPRIERVGPGVHILGVRGDEPTLVAQGNVLVMSFHPELSGSDDIHRYFLERVVAPVRQGDTTTAAHAKPGVGPAENQLDG